MSHSSFLFPDLDTFQEPREPSRIYGTGVFPSQRIQDFIDSNSILASSPIEEIQIQPASLDLRLGPVAYRVRASFLPGSSSTVDARIRELGMAEVDLRHGAILEKRCVYVVPLMEEWNFPDTIPSRENVPVRANISGKANPKSTTGRLDIFTRLITDFGTEFEKVPSGYKGRRLYAEVVPRTFTVKVREGMRLNQIRFVRGSPPSLEKGEGKLGTLHEKEPFAYTPDDNPAESPDRISIDLSGSAGGTVVGYKAKIHAPLVDLAQVGFYDPEEFWEPIPPCKRIILNPDDFYILVSREKVSVPPQYAAEMVAYDPSVGEFRIHYAGFFDPGFGYGLDQGRGTHAVLEVRSHEVPFVIEDGQVVGRLRYERLTEAPQKVYGAGIGSSYQAQGLSLSKQFRRR